MELKSHALAICFGLAMTSGLAQTGNNSGAREQSVFSAEEEGSVERPVALPQAVLNILRSDRHVLVALKVDKIPPDQLPASWFTGSEIHLDGPNEIDLVVTGVGRMRGANVNSFWVFRKTTQGYQLVLNTAAHELIVLSTKRNGYREIRCGAPIAGFANFVVYRFDGTKYEVLRKESKPVR